jgi:tetratricopeptide (TPR) repeat protein
MLTGCDFSKQAPDPPHAEAALVSELLSALKNKDYSLAEKKLKRLGAIDADKMYLDNIRIRLQNNLHISRAQVLLDSGDVDGAIEILNQRISIDGPNTSLVGAVNQLEEIKSIKQLTDKVLEAESSRELAVSSGKLNRAISSYPSAKKLYEFSTSRIDRARSLLSIEKLLAIEDLKADIDIAWVQGKTYLDTMIAGLEVQKPENPLSSAYRAAMQKNWKNGKISELNYTPENEFIFFRKGLLLEDNQERKDIYSTLLSFSPNSFRSLLIKAMLLKFAGYSKESSKITKEISETIPVSSFGARRWFRLRPDNIIGINKINPFVLYPFLIYYGGG